MPWLASVFIVVPRKFRHMLRVLKASNFPSMEALCFFIDPSHLRSSFPWKSELFRVFSEVLMVVRSFCGYLEKTPCPNSMHFLETGNITIRGWLSQKEKQCIDMQHV